MDVDVDVDVDVGGVYGVRAIRRINRLSNRSNSRWRKEGSSGRGSQAGMMRGSLGASGL